MIAIVIVILLFLYRRKQLNSVRNYVDSNGRDVGIAVEEGNPVKKTFRRLFYGFPTINNNPTHGDFDEDMPEDMVSESKPNLDSDFNSNNYSSNTGFVVNRPKPLHLVNNDAIPEDQDSDSSLDLASETQSPSSIPKTNLEENDTGEAQHPAVDTEDTDDIDTDEYVLAADSASPTDSYRGNFPRLDHDTNNTSSD